MLIAYEAPSSARARSVVASKVVLLPNVVAILLATISEDLSRVSSMSKRQIVESASSGNERMSPIRFFAKTVLPAPIKVIFLRELLMILILGIFNHRLHRLE